MKKLFLPLILSLALLLQSCSSLLPFLATSTPTLVPTSTITPTLTATPTPLPSPTATPSPTPLPATRIDNADLLVQSGDYAKALQEYQSSYNTATDDPTRAAALIGVGRIQLLQGTPLVAITTLTDAINRFPQGDKIASADYFLGQAYAAMNNHPKALEAYATYLQKKPGVLDAYIQDLRGDTFAAMDDYKSALDAYTASAKASQLGDPTDVKLKIGQMYAALSDNKNALRTYLAVYDATQNEYYKAQANLLAGHTYLKMGMLEQAQSRYLDSVNNFPRPYDSYTALVALVNDNVKVDELKRGMVDYFAGQYGYALEALNRYLAANPKAEGTATAHYYKALTLINQNLPQDSIAEWDLLIKNFPQDQHWAAAWDEKAYTQWYYLNLYPEASQTLLDFVNQAPTDPTAPAELFEAGRILERKNLLAEAAQVWETIIQKFPASDFSMRALLLAGVSYYRIGKMDRALAVFQRLLLLGLTPSEQASAYLWIGKTQAASNDLAAAQASWELGAQRDPSGYYSERCRELQLGQAPFQEKLDLNLNFDAAAERKLAEGWMRVTFKLPGQTDFSTLGLLASDARAQRATAFWELGLYSQARDEYESIRLDVQKDPESSFRLLTQLLKQGFYRSAILTARQVLDLSGMDEAATLSGPSYFNHIRFGLYFKDYVLSAAQTETFNPLFLFSVIRQESLFEGFATSGAGARGVMQIVPATGSEVARNLGWPPDFTSEDLYLPMISIRLGAHYLGRQSAAFDSDLFASLAAYNGGPGNAQAWGDLAGNDPDLLLEVIRITETRQYIMQIFEFYGLYERLYAKNQ